MSSSRLKEQQRRASSSRPAVAIPNGAIAKLQRIARENGVSLADVVRYALALLLHIYATAETPPRIPKTSTRGLSVRTPVQLPRIDGG